jgi:hypothetical protein
MALKIFGQQAMALGRVLTIAACFTDPSVYFLGGGMVQAEPGFRNWYLDTVRQHTDLREEQARVASFALVPDLDMNLALAAGVDRAEGSRPTLPRPRGRRRRQGPWPKLPPARDLAMLLPEHHELVH